MPSMITTVLFDLADTLTDVASFGPSVLVRAAEERGHALSVAELQRYPGARYLPLVQQLLGVPEHEAAAIYARYVQLYRVMMLDGLREHRGATELLRALADRGVRVGLVTNELDALAREIVALLGWADLIPVIVGMDTSPYRKPDPAVVRFALDALSARPEAAAAVGDSVDDMAGASGAGIGTVVGMLVTTPGERLSAAGATDLCADLNEVRALLLPRIVANG
jgi:HAD superfamily hydrolase (TIGR01549 family)